MDLRLLSPYPKTPVLQWPGFVNVFGSLNATRVQL
jgi:hypothetical protein